MCEGHRSISSGMEGYRHDKRNIPTSTGNGGQRRTLQRSVKKIQKSAGRPAAGKRSLPVVNGRGPLRAALTITGSKGNRSLYLLYVWTGIDTNCVLVSYHHAAGNHSARDDQAWSQIIAGLDQ